MIMKAYHNKIKELKKNCVKTRQLKNSKYKF